jgi:hypothetical protein
MRWIEMFRGSLAFVSLSPCITAAVGLTPYPYLKVGGVFDETRTEGVPIFFWGDVNGGFTHPLDLNIENMRFF